MTHEYISHIIRITHTYSLYCKYFIHVGKTFLGYAPFDFDLAIVSWMKLRITQNVASRNCRWMLLVLKNLVQINITLCIFEDQNEFYLKTASVYGICDDIWIILEYIVSVQGVNVGPSVSATSCLLFGLLFLVFWLHFRLWLRQIIIPYSNAHS